MCIHIGAVYGHRRRDMNVILIYFIHRVFGRRPDWQVQQDGAPEAVHTSAQPTGDSFVNTTFVQLLLLLHRVHVFGQFVVDIP